MRKFGRALGSMGWLLSIVGSILLAVSANLSILGVVGAGCIGAGVAVLCVRFEQVLAVLRKPQRK